jgi:hypothetical protein
LVEWLKERHEFLQATGEGAGRQMKATTAQFGEDTVQWLEERELVLQDHHPQGDADVVFGDEFVGRRCRDDGGRAGTLTTAAITFAAIAAAIATDLDLQDVTISGAGNLLKRQLAGWAAFLVVGQVAGFGSGGQMIVVASPMALGAALLAA